MPQPHLALSQPGAEVWIPPVPSLALPGDFRKVTHLGVGAHADDLEFMALHGILECYGRADRGFFGVTVTDGVYRHLRGTVEGATLRQLRREEQRQAAEFGCYAAMVQLDVPSATLTPSQREPQGSDTDRLDLASPPGCIDGPPYPTWTDVVGDLRQVLRATQPEVVYTHNPFDRHPTHLGVLHALLEAILGLPPSARPNRLLGCEVWRGLDWLPPDWKVPLPIPDCQATLVRQLLGSFPSQVANGKAYDQAVLGRLQANATFADAYQPDGHSGLAWAVNLTPVIAGETPVALADWVDRALDASNQQVRSALSGH